MISKRARIIEKAMSSIGLRKIITKMMLNPKRDNKYIEPPKSIYRKYDVESFSINSSKYISIKSSSNPEKHIVYFHGGAYTMQATILHWKIVDYILSSIPCELTFINYPLAPEHTCTECIEVVKKIYTDLFKTSIQEIILMGDSAGGGLALALAQAIDAEKIEVKPNKILLLCPWLDVSMEDDLTKELQNKDLILNRETLQIIGKKYAGELDTKHYLCSPLYGDLTSIGEIAIFTGTNDILNFQANILKDKIINGCDNLSYYEYSGMQHVWMGFPITEATDAMEKIIDIISRK